MSRPAAAALAALALCATPLAAAGQTMLDQQQRLIDIHSLLVDLPPLQAPAALERGTLGASLEAVSIPEIDGTTGTKEQITASDRTRLFPRPRLMLGLPAPEGFRAFVGLSYIPPIAIREVSTHLVGGEAGFGWAPGALRVAARLHAVYAHSRAPVTDPATHDVLDAGVWGADAALGWRLDAGSFGIEPYAGGGFASLHGRFEVTSDGNVLSSDWTGAALHAGLRLLFRSRWEVVAEVDGYPGRLVHTNVRAGYLFVL